MTPADTPSSPPPPAPPRPPEEDNFLDSLPQQFLESMLGEDAARAGAPTPRGSASRCLRILRHLALPRSNQFAFSAAFWVLRAAGAVVLASWIYFGLRYSVWDASKCTAGLGILFLGPLVFRAVEFLLETFVLKGASRSSWRDFWNFKRMMTPRSIQTGFFLGFWGLVVAGGTIVAGGFGDLILLEEVGSLRSALLASYDNVQDAGNLAAKLIDSQSPFVKYVRGKLTPATLDALNRHDPSQPLQPSLRSSLSEELQATLQSRSNSFVKILKGLLVMLLGPMALRLTAESIILFFRMNETLTDISKQLETLNRRTGPNPSHEEPR